MGMHDVCKYAVTEYMWKSEDNSLEFSFHLCGWRLNSDCMANTLTCWTLPRLDSNSDPPVLSPECWDGRQAALCPVSAVVLSLKSNYTYYYTVMFITWTNFSILLHQSIKMLTAA